MTSRSSSSADIQVLARYWIFVSLCAISAALLFKPIEATRALAVHNDEFTHILLILPISATLIFSEWRWLKSSITSSPRMGGALLAAGAIGALAATMSFSGGAPGTQLSLGVLALVILWAGAFVLCFGTTVAKHSLFPLCFLLWMVPLPSIALTRIVHWLQTGSALSASWLFAVLGVPVSRAGDVLSIPGLSIEVARECSSIRSSLMLLVTTMVLAHLFLRSRWRKAMVILLAVPLSVIKNGLRIVVISLLGTRVNRDYLTGWLHQQGGIIFLLLALGVILLVIWLLRAGEQIRGRKSVRSSQRTESLATAAPM